jgi:hypothetical protein
VWRRPLQRLLTRPLISNRVMGDLLLGLLLVLICLALGFAWTTSCAAIWASGLSVR